MALSGSKPDARNPDTAADKARGLSPANFDKHDPEDAARYGFSTIDTKGAKEAAEAGPGVVEPERYPSVATEGGSTFASRKAEREKRGDTRVRPDAATSK